MTLSMLLKDLERLLATPRPVSERLQALADRMTGRCPDAAGLASLVVRLYDPSMDERWIAELWPSTQLLLATTATSLQAPVKLRHHLIALVHQLRHDFKPQVDTDRRRPPFVRAPFAAFHFSLWRGMVRGKASIYIVLAALIHARVRALERGMVQDARFGSRLESNLYSYLRPARIGCLYGPPLHELTVALRWELINAIA